jgi:hypothetical protein
MTMLSGSGVRHPLTNRIRQYRSVETIVTDWPVRTKGLAFDLRLRATTRSEVAATRSAGDTLAGCRRAGRSFVLMRPPGRTVRLGQLPRLLDATPRKSGVRRRMTGDLPREEFHAGRRRKLSTQHLRRPFEIGDGGLGPYGRPISRIGWLRKYRGQFAQLRGHGVLGGFDAGYKSGVPRLNLVPAVGQGRVSFELIHCRLLRGAPLPLAVESRASQRLDRCRSASPREFLPFGRHCANRTQQLSEQTPDLVVIGRPVGGVGVSVEEGTRNGSSPISTSTSSRCPSSGTYRQARTAVSPPLVAHWTRSDRRSAVLPETEPDASPVTGFHASTTVRAAHGTRPLRGPVAASPRLCEVEPSSTGDPVGRRTIETGVPPSAADRSAKTTASEIGASGDRAAATAASATQRGSGPCRRSFAFRSGRGDDERSCSAGESSLNEWSARLPLCSWCSVCSTRAVSEHSVVDRCVLGSSSSSG